MKNFHHRSYRPFSILKWRLYIYIYSILVDIYWNLNIYIIKNWLTKFCLHEFLCILLRYKSLYFTNLRGVGRGIGEGVNEGRGGGYTREGVQSGILLNSQKTKNLKWSRWNFIHILFCSICEFLKQFTHYFILWYLILFGEIWFSFVLVLLKWQFGFVGLQSARYNLYHKFSLFALTSLWLFHLNWKLRWFVIYCDWNAVSRMMQEKALN